MKKLILIISCILSIKINQIDNNSFIIKNPIEQKAQEIDYKEEKKYSLYTNNMSLTNFCKALEKILDKKITNLFPSDIKITIRLEDLNEDDIIYELIDQFNIGFIKTDTGYKVYPPKMISKIFPIHYHGFTRNGSGSSGGSQRTGGGSGSANISTRNGDKFWQDLDKELKSIIDKGNKEAFFINETEKHITVTGFPKTLYNAEKIIKRINNNYRYQIMLEGKIIQWTRYNTNYYNIEWENIINTIQYANSLNFTQGNILNTFVNKLIKSTSDNGKTTILSSPKISMFNNQTSLLQFGKSSKELQQLTIDQDETKNNNSIVSNRIKYELQDVFLGIIFSASANIINKDEAILHIQPMISSEITNKEAARIKLGEDKSGTVEIPYKTIDQKQSDSVIRAGHNDIIIIGGLTNTSTIVSYNATNLLQYIFPFLQSKQYRFKQDEIIIIIQIQIIEHLTEQNIIKYDFML